MAWPIPHVPLDANKTNQLAQVDDHPDHHNDIAEAVNAIEAETGSLRGRVTAVESGKASAGALATTNSNVAANTAAIADKADADDFADHISATVDRENLEMVVYQVINGNTYFIRYDVIAQERHGLRYMRSVSRDPILGGGTGFPGGAITTQNEVTIRFNPVIPAAPIALPLGTVRVWEDGVAPQHCVLIRGGGDDYRLIAADGGGNYGGGANDILCAAVVSHMTFQLVYQR